MKIKLNKKILLIITAALLLSVTFVAAIFVFMTPSQKTITAGQSADFTCTVDPMLGAASYKIELIGDHVNKVLKSGTNDQSVFDVPVTVQVADYDNWSGTYTVRCTATETLCDPCCCDSDSADSTLIINPPECPLSDWYCSAEEVRQYIRWYWNGQRCVAELVQTGEDCDEEGGAYGDGCYVYSNGCEDRNYYCVEGTGPNTPCNYDFNNRHTDSYSNYIYYCFNEDVYKHRLFYDYYCEGQHNGVCTEHQSWTDNSLVQDCGEDSCTGWQNICGTGNNASIVFRMRTCHDRGCTNAACFDNINQETEPLENCDDYDGWYDTGNKRWINYTICKEKEQKEQEYRNYYCTLGACAFTINNTRWINTSNTRNKPDGTSCNDGLFCTDPDTCQAGTCIGLTRNCSDNLFCTIDSCNETIDQCTYAPKDCSAFNISQIATCDHNPDNYHFTWDFRNWFTSTCDENNDQCTTGNTNITHTCDVEQCDAECENDADCDDQNIYTLDSCLANCTCKHEGQPYCGDGFVNLTAGETCELPSTSNNVFCPQSTSQCSGNKLGTRDGFGNCNAVCGCTYDNFQYNCVKDQCGATCDSNDDCCNKCVGNVRYYGGSCDLTTSCSCSWNTENCDLNDGWYDTNNTRWIDDVICKEREQKEQNYKDYYCAPGACAFTVNNTRWINTSTTRNKLNGTSCNDGLFCTDNDVCTNGQCGGTSKDCSGFNISRIETCFNNPDNFFFTWDFRHEFVSVCDEDNDRCTTGNETITHTCDVVRCGAECVTDYDCYDKEASSYRCLEDCTCEIIMPTLRTTSSGSGGGGGGGSSGSSIALTSWICSEWTECVDGERTQTCTLGSVTSKNTQTCTSAAATASVDLTIASSGKEEQEEGTAESEANTVVLSSGNNEAATGNSAPIVRISDNEITGMTAGVGKGAGFAINWYVVVIAVMVMLCLPLFFFFLSKK